MTAAQVIDEIKIMAPEEREKVADFLRKGEDRPEVRYADDQAAEEASQRIMKRHGELLRKLAS